ncbi:hypothetical protein [Streptomyces sp. NPDC016845]|uniref:hypothetical protein n=1 Tax=Streptomyces sp. NPDC016845 TaxID=3364972 RepID=UPI00379F2BCB
MTSLVTHTIHDVDSDHGMLAIVPDRDDDYGPSPAIPVHGWFAASEHEIHIRVAQELVEQRLRFELWDGPPSPPSQPPEVEGNFLIDVPLGPMSIYQFAAGGIPDAFAVSPGRYSLRLSGYGRSITAQQAARLQQQFRSAGLADPAFTAARNQLAGQELYLAQLWPAETGR